MDPLLMLDNKLVKVEGNYKVLSFDVVCSHLSYKNDAFISVVSVVAMEETQNYHCIICNGEFITIAERNEHLETHFIHRNCKSCCRPVVVIGGLEFELHHPTHCKESESYEEVDILDGDYSMDAESGEMFDNNSDDEKEIVIFEKETWTHGSPEKNEKYEINIEKTNKENGDLISKTDDKEHNLTQKVQKRPTRKCTNVQYSNEQNGEIGTETEEEEEEKETKKRILVRNVKREPAKRGRKPRKIVKRSDIYPDDDVDEKDGEDDVVRAMDFAMRKRRINYAKLPKTIPCGVSTCDIKFSSDRALKCHMTQAHGIKERYICPICSREFKISGNLKQHVETHTDYKRFICNYCGKGFHLPFNLKEHINSHTVRTTFYLLSNCYCFNAKFAHICRVLVLGNVTCVTRLSVEDLCEKLTDG